MALPLLAVILALLAPVAARPSVPWAPSPSRASRRGPCFLPPPVPSRRPPPPSSSFPLTTTTALSAVQVQYEEVSRANFHGVLDRMREVGAEAAFWTLDTEFTGYKQSEKDEFFDTLQQRYVKKKEVGERYLVVQMGLSAFVWDPQLDDFRAYTWNVHLFPSTMVERTFICDASSLSFLRAHGLDFNAWVEGVPFLALEQETSLRKQIEDQADFDMRAAVMGKRPTQRGPLDANADANTTALYNRLLEELDALGPGGVVELPEVVPFFRKRMVEQTVQRHPKRINLWVEKAGEGGRDAGMRVRFVTELERQAIVMEKKEAALGKLEEAAGAMRILEVIKGSGRPLVGHNFLLDLLFLYSHFVKPTLPETAMGFKTKLQRHFPDIYDTKVLAKALGVSDATGDTNLEGLYRCETNGDRAADTAGQLGGAADDSHGAPPAPDADGAGASAHEAGHDAYMTGVVFAGLLRKAGAAAGATASTGNQPSMAHAEPWVNKIFMRMSDIDTFELRNFKQVPDRTRVFHVRTQGNGTLPLLQHRDLRDAFSPLGSHQIKALGKQEAFVVFHDTSKPPPEVATLKQMAASRLGASGSVLEITTFEERRVLLGHIW